MCCDTELKRLHSLPRPRQFSPITDMVHSGDLFEIATAVGNVPPLEYSVTDNGYTR